MVDVDVVVDVWLVEVDGYVDVGCLGGRFGS